MEHLCVRILRIRAKFIQSFIHSCSTPFSVSEPVLKYMREGNIHDICIWEMVLDLGVKIDLLPKKFWEEQINKYKS